jgi:RNA polymerase sigma-70 factor, ECF subfamily
MASERSSVTSASDEIWFLEQVQANQGRLRAFIRGQGVRSEAVDDLAQEALLICLSKLDEFDRGGDFGAWARQIARRLVANERRKQARRHQIQSDHVADILLEMSRESAGVGDRLVLVEELSALRDCLRSLPGTSRELLRQRYVEDLSAGAIGSRLGWKSNHVRQALLRLRRALLGCIVRRLGMEPA